MTDTTDTTVTVRTRPSLRGIAGYLLITAGLVALVTDVPAKSGQTIGGLVLAAAGTWLVAGVLRRQAVRRTA